MVKTDVRVGGRRLVGMQLKTPNGPMSMWSVGEHREVTPSNRLVYTESMSDEHGTVIAPSDMGVPEGHPETTVVTVGPEEFDGRTKMVLTHAGIPSGSPGAAG